MSLGAAIWIGDVATGRHLQTSLSGVAKRLGAWYESERLPAVLCTPGRKVLHASLPGIDFSVPECWRHEVLGLLDREVHQFYDPDARAGMVSVSVETGESPEDIEALHREFQTLASMPDAEVHEADSAAAADRPAAAEPGLTRRHGADSLAERIRPAQTADAPQHPARGPSPFRRVETSAVLGVGPFPMAEPVEGSFADRPTSSGQPMAVLSWLLLSDGLAVRVQYAVREDWSTDSVVRGEIQRVHDLVSSVRPSR